VLRVRIINLDNLSGNEILGKPIYNEVGRTLLAQGTTLTPGYIEKLKNLGISSVYIEDGISSEVVLEETITEETRQVSKRAINDMMEKYSRDGKLKNEGILKSVNSIMDDILMNKDVMINISDIRAKDDEIYSHSVNVCVLSTLIGIHLGYNMLRLKEIGIGAILHDIGKVKILGDKKIVEERKKIGDLPEYIEKMHPKVGYDFLSQHNVCGAVSKVAVLMHHEKIDGSGYPLGLKNEEIHEVAMLVSICNAFDNMISGHNGLEAKPVYQALEYLIGMSGHYYDANIVNKFTVNIAAFPSGSGVRLNTNERCLVIRQNHSLPLRPVLKVIYGKNNEKVAEPYELDLIKELTLFITQACEL